MKQVEREKVEAQIKARYEAVINSLTECARRLFVAAEARALRHGGIAMASRATGMAPSVIGSELKELDAIEVRGCLELPRGRSRRRWRGRGDVALGWAFDVEGLGSMRALGD